MYMEPATQEASDPPAARVARGNGIVDVLSRRPVLVMRLGVGLTLVLLLLLLWIGRDIYRVFGGVQSNAVRFEQLVRAGLLHGELTRCARMTALTGDSAWAHRHRNTVAVMDSLVALFVAGAGDIHGEREARQLATSNDHLVALESEALRLSAAGRRAEALRLLSSQRYDHEKERFSHGLSSLTAGYSSGVRSAEAVVRRSIALVLLAAGGGVVALLGLWLTALTLIRRYIAGHSRAEERERELIREQAARAIAERANRAKNEFLSRMSHELRTPLNAILGFGQLLQADPSIQDRESVEQILKAGRHLLSLIDEVLDLARIEAGRMSISVEPVPVSHVLGESLDLVRHMAEEHGITVDGQPALDSGEFVLADQQRLKQVLLNLLSNAIKYNRPGGSVHVTCHADVGEGVRISVRDTGQGIPAEVQERLFTPFERLGGEQSGVQGTGLGLALSEGLVHAMGGQLTMESAVGVGTTFTVCLRGAPRPVPADAAVPGGGQKSTRRQTHAVLLVEDNLANVRLIERILTRRPHVRLLTAMQGRIALDLAREQRPDLILLDVHLPDISGIDVLRTLRHDPDLVGIPVVMVSADSVRASRFAAMGARGWMTKPVSVTELLQVVDDTLAAGRQAERGGPDGD